MAVGTYIANWNGKSWSTPALFPFPSKPLQDYRFEAISCSSARFCMAVGGQRGAYDESERDYYYNDVAATWNGESWSALKWPGADWPGVEVLNLSCASASFCMVSDSVIWSGNSWSLLNVAPAGGLQFLSCLSASFCFGSNGSDLYTWKNKTWSAWSRSSKDDYSGGPTTCPSTSFCASAFGSDVSTWDGTTWSALVWHGRSWSAPSGLPEAPLDLDEISCASASFCVAVGGGYFTVAAPA
jgi:hypothetical protein